MKQPNYRNRYLYTCLPAKFNASLNTGRKLAKEEALWVNIGDLLSDLRLDHKLKQKDLAQFLNVSIATISHYESGVNMPDPETLVRLANFYGVSADYLLGRIRIRADYKTLFKKVRLPNGHVITMEDVMIKFLKLSGESQAAVIKLIDLYKLGDNYRHATFLPSLKEEA